MSVRLLLDVHVHRAIAITLRRRGVDILTAQEDGSARLTDPELLDRAAILGRVLVTYDSDLLAEAHRRQRERTPFTGVVYAHLHQVTIRSMVDDLTLISQTLEPEDLADRVEFLPL